MVLDEAPVAGLQDALDLDCAERFLSDGKSVAAAEIYDEVRRADVPKQRILEATRGAILARSQEGIPLLLEQFRSPEKSLFHSGSLESTGGFCARM